MGGKRRRGGGGVAGGEGDFTAQGEKKQKTKCICLEYPPKQRTFTCIFKDVFL